MTGIRREWVGGEFVQVHLGLLDVLGGDYETAAVIWAVKWHAGTGWWAATREELQVATRLTPAKLRRALKVARDGGYLQSRDSASYDRTLSWRVVYAEEPQVNAHSAESSRPTGESRIEQAANTSRSSSSQKKKTSSEGRGKPRTAPPDTLEPNAATLAAATEVGLTVTSQLVQQCLDYHRAQGNKRADWQATLRTWIRRQREWAPRGGATKPRADGTVPTTLAELSDEDERLVRAYVQQNPPRTDDLDVTTAEGKAERERRRAVRIAEEIAELWRTR